MLVFGEMLIFNIGFWPTHNALAGIELRHLTRLLVWNHYSIVKPTMDAFFFLEPFNGLCVALYVYPFEWPS